jgi:hypothetical protein
MFNSLIALHHRVHADLARNLQSIKTIKELHREQLKQRCIYRAAQDRLLATVIGSLSQEDSLETEEYNLSPVQVAYIRKIVSKYE